jgi:hypothetical protein
LDFSSTLLWRLGKDRRARQDSERDCECNFHR